MSDRPVTLTIAALGGQGGGVVQNWMIDVAESAGYQVQATSVPGVAQRTGATIYYMEFAPGTDAAPVMALMPAAGACDLVVASELVEAARMVQRRLVNEQTTLVASTHRAYSIDEKSHLADGRVNSDELLGLIRERAGRCITFDMDTVAAESGSVISAAILGGIAASGVLPFDLRLYEQAIERGGKGTAPSLAAFRASQLAVQGGAGDEVAIDDEVAGGGAADLSHLPAPVAAIAHHALPRLTDYMDDAYAGQYLSELEPFLAYPDTELAEAVARGLALWMTYEDTIRVADLKTRPERLRRLQGSSGGEGTVVHVVEFMKPRIEEIAGTLPAPIGRWLDRSSLAGWLLRPFTQGLKVRSTSIGGYVMLRCLAKLKKYRRGSWRHQRESREISGWLSLVADLAGRNYALAVELARCQSLIAGYGETYERGLSNYRKIAEYAQGAVAQENAAVRVRALRAAAEAEESGTELEAAIKGVAPVV